MIRKVEALTGQDRTGDDTYAAHLMPLLIALVGSRRVLIATYLSLLAVASVLLTIFGIPYGSKPLKAQYAEDALETSEEVLAFLALQALFLWGGGRIRLKMRPVRFRKTLVSFIIFAALMLVVTAGMVANFWGLTGWSFWLAIGWFALRHVDQPTALSRLITILLAGSWVEFAAALPIQISTRNKTEDCPCATGSWLALMTGVPILVWAIGPGLYLLYLQQSRLEQLEHRHITKILLRKSKSARVGKPL
jgi:hypothetical protein